MSLNKFINPELDKKKKELVKKYNSARSKESKKKIMAQIQLIEDEIRRF